MAFINAVALPLRAQAKSGLKDGLAGLIAGAACAASFGFITLMLFAL